MSHAQTEGKVLGSSPMLNSQAILNFEGGSEKSTSESVSHSQFRSQYQMSIFRTSFFGVVWFFGPLVYRLIVNRHGQRDLRLVTEARKVIAESRANNSGPSRTEIVLKMHLELQTILCTEYRYVCL